MKKNMLFACVLMSGSVAAHHYEKNYLVHMIAVDDVYKLAVQGKATTYKDFQQVCKSLTVEQIHAKLAGLDAQALHSVNNVRLARYEKCLERCVVKPVEHASDRQPSIYDEIVKANAALKLEKERQDMLTAKLRTRSARYAAPDLRFKELQKNYRKNSKKAVLGAIGSTALIIVGGYASYHNMAPYGQEVLMLGGVSGLVGCASLSGTDAAIDPAFYFNEKADHERRKELINRMCKKS